MDAQNILSTSTKQLTALDGAEEKTIEKIHETSFAKTIHEHITILDLSNKNFVTVDDNVKLPINLIELNLFNNKLNEVPVSVLNLENLKVLELSHNSIKCFDDKPKFCHTIQKIGISHNDLHGPPYWMWSEAPKSLIEINLSCNVKITQFLHSGYYKELLKYKTPIQNVIIYNCKLKECLSIISTFPNARSLVLGSTDFSCYSQNILEEVPCNGIYECCDIEYLNLSYTNVYNVNSGIQMFSKLKYINLSHNKLHRLPQEFCLLENLETCILSSNSLCDLPVNFCNLKRITSLHVDCNELYTLPSGICYLPFIRKLDAYNNYLYELPNGIENLVEVDLAQNYFEEPNDEEYLVKRKLIRVNGDYRYDGGKVEEESCESYHSESADEKSSRSGNGKLDTQDNFSNSSEDWDSDSYWVPDCQFYPSVPPGNRLSWKCFVQQKMKDGNFCPMDAHPVPIGDQLKYFPKVEYESDGQFDDLSDDN